MSHCSSWSGRSGCFGRTVPRHLIPRIGGLHWDPLNMSGRAHRGLRPPSATASARPVRPPAAGFSSRQPSNRRRPSVTSRFIDFFNGVADASITKKLFARLNGSHTIAMSLEHRPPFPRMGLGTVPNEPLTSSHAEAQTQGDLKASVKEIDDLRRGAARRSPNGRASATKSYLSRKP